MTSSPLNEAWDDYIAVLREDAHLLLAWGYADSCPKLATAVDEYDMTGFLADAMDERINNPSTPERFTLYSVHNERPVGTNDKTGKKRPKLDVQLEQCGVRPKRRYTFEMKRLRDDAKATPADCVGHYTGPDGVRRFVEGRYAADSSEAVMVAFVQARTTAFWMTLVAQACGEDSQLNLVESFRLYPVITELADEASTVHSRPNTSHIRVLHIFLNCVQ